MQPTIKDLNRETLGLVITVAVLWVFKVCLPESYETIPFKVGFDFFRFFGFPVAGIYYFMDKKKIKKSAFPAHKKGDG